MAMDARQRYRAYLLRIWQAGNGDAPEWRFSVEDVRTHERHGFEDLASLAAFLEHQMGERSGIGAQPAAGETDGSPT